MAKEFKREMIWREYFAIMKIASEFSKRPLRYGEPSILTLPDGRENMFFSNGVFAVALDFVLEGYSSFEELNEANVEKKQQAIFNLLQSEAVPHAKVPAENILEWAGVNMDKPFMSCSECAGGNRWIWCRECSETDGPVECVCLTCGDVHERECSTCDGSGKIMCKACMPDFDMDKPVRAGRIAGGMYDKDYVGALMKPYVDAPDRVIEVSTISSFISAPGYQVVRFASEFDGFTGYVLPREIENRHAENPLEYITTDIDGKPRRIGEIPDLIDMSAVPAP